MGRRGVLLYHRVNDTESDYNRITVEEKNFFEHMSYLKHNYKIVTFEEMLSYEGKEDVITVTFDDGFADFYEKALPILIQLQIPATIFITTGKIDTSTELWTTELLKILFANHTGEEKIRVNFCGRQVTLPIYTLEERIEAYRIFRHILMQVSARERETILNSIRRQMGVEEQGRKEYRLLSKAEILEIATNPLVTIGAHTVNHVSMGRIDGRELLYEIQESVRYLEYIIGQQVKYFAYPFGEKADYSDKAVELLRENGIKAACTVEGRLYDKNQDSSFKIPRMCIGNWKIGQFHAKLQEWFGGQTREVTTQCEIPLLYIGKLEADRNLWQSDRKAVIWGTGIRGKKIYALLCKQGQSERVVAFGDNDSRMWEREIDNIPVWNAEQIKQYGETDIIIYNTKDRELVQQFVRMGFKYIHWVI